MAAWVLDLALAAADPVPEPTRFVSEKQDRL